MDSPFVVAQLKAIQAIAAENLNLSEFGDPWNDVFTMASDALTYFQAPKA